MNKLYLILWNGNTVYDSEWHCSVINSNKKLVELKLEVACIEHPNLTHIMVEIDDPTPPAVMIQTQPAITITEVGEFDEPMGLPDPPSEKHLADIENDPHLQ